MQARLSFARRLPRALGEDRASGASRQYAGDSGWVAVGVMLLALGCTGVYLLLGLF